MPGCFFVRPRMVPRCEKLCGAVGELEGAKPASNEIECPAKPCRARRAARAAGTFTLYNSVKVTALFFWGKASAFPQKNSAAPARGRRRSPGGLRRLVRRPQGPVCALCGRQDLWCHHTTRKAPWQSEIFVCAGWRRLSRRSPPTPPGPPG